MPRPPAPPPSPDGPPPREGGDACPGTLRLHSADDGLLARVRLPGGVLTAPQARALQDAADRLGDGSLHITSRGNVQLRGLSSDCSGPLAQRLDAAGLLPSARHERVRNVLASPLSGLDGDGHLPVRPWLRELDTLLCTSDATTALSGRFLFALDDGRGDVAGLDADVTLLAVSAGEALLLVAGTPAAVVPAAEAPRAALFTATAFLGLAAGAGGRGAAGASGRVWRIAELPGGPGPLADALPGLLRDAGVPATGQDSSAAPPTAPGPSPGAVFGPGGSVTLSALAPLGLLTGSRWRALLDAAERDGSGEILLTPWRGVLVPGVPRHRAAALLASLDAAGLVTDPGSPWIGVGACVGRPGCAKSLADVRADAAASLPPAPGLPVYWSGCERRCGRPQGTRIDVLATGEGYRVTAPGAGRPRDVAARPADLAAALAAARGHPGEADRTDHHSDDRNDSDAATR
ncbi:MULTISPECIES: precorrin-3B synthase [unclassified Streptomyces]|uniref:precorrin-3B synthase n=1 Tax=unclassified Streptomyces TaxID=2593676 RepID=UPI0022B6AAB7|nr:MULTISPECIES: precorrin-3B synthase [unclassified Streptomyces]MCZ7415266.1 precorrin-3B synthase [Streptomyces sp. WMMC897]MCZ7432208.1 precorrin-3B synthase [Streptomyces sp. WMMC1477]